MFVRERAEMVLSPSGSLVVDAYVSRSIADIFAGRDPIPGACDSAAEKFSFGYIAPIGQPSGEP